MNNQNISKNIQPLHRKLANYILGLNQDERIPGIRELAELLDASVGSVSQAIRDLEARGCVSISRRGRMGSYIEELSIGPLWTIIESVPLIGGLTLASNPRYEGLATGLKTMFTNVGIETYMMFIRGSRNRLKALHDDRCHYVAISYFAAKSLTSSTDQIVKVLPPKSFVSSHRVFYNSVSTQNSGPIKVGIDYDSYDQAKLTEMEFEGQDAEFVDLTFTQIERHLSEGIVDCAVWTEDDMIHRSNPIILDRPLSQPVRDLLKKENTCAAIVALSKNKAVHAAIDHVFDNDEILRIQEDVIEGQILPEF